MFTVGQFAQLGRITVRALHHYDRIDLLKPAAIEPNGYRSYQAKQLHDLNRILALKELGFSLTEITKMAGADVTREQLLGMLHMRQVEAEREADAEQLRLAQARVRIDLLEEPSMSDLDATVIVKPLPSMRVAAVTEVINDFDQDFKAMLPRLFTTLSEETIRLGIRPPIGPIFSMFLDRDDAQIDVIAAVRLQPDEEFESETVQIIDLPAVERAATLVSVGDPTLVGPGNQLHLFKWLELSDEPRFDHYREVYLQERLPYEDFVIEMQVILKSTEHE